MLDLVLNAHRGSFHLQLSCALASNWTVVFGPSGAGKTTLLRLLAGLDRARRSDRLPSRIVFDGQTLVDTASGLWLRPGRRNTSLVSQHPSLFPHMTAAENVAYGLRRLSRAARAARVDQVLTLVDATGLASRRPQDLSGGQAQRVALARALAPSPRLLLLDEPFSALDGFSSDSLLARLQHWCLQNSIQAILATHDVSDALSTGAEVLLLREGRLTAQGPAAHVLASERDRLLGRLLIH